MSNWITIAGQNVLDAIAKEREACVPHSEIPGRENCYQSDHLCAFQSKMSTRGYTGAEICKSMYGYSLRYASGLNDFALIYSARCKDVDGSFEDAARRAVEWQAEQPNHRYVQFAA